jgi:hypothetical protein
VAPRRQARDTGAYLVRVAFGSTLLINLVLVRLRRAVARPRRAGVRRGATEPRARLRQVVTALAVLSSSRSKGDDDDDSRRAGGGGGGGGFRLSFRFLNVPAALLGDFCFWDTSDVQRRRRMLWTDRDYEMGFLEARARARWRTWRGASALRRMTDADPPPRMLFYLAPQSVFSVVFGDGDPNAGFERERWAAVGAYIRSSGGCVAAEELAPFLEPPPLLRGAATSLAGTSAFEDESFMLPALTRFNGVPEVTPAGGIVYCFPDLRPTGAAPQAAEKRSFSAPLHLREAGWEFSRAPGPNARPAILLGVADAAGVIYLTAMLRSPDVLAQAGADTVAALTWLLPGLQAYAVLLFAIPAARWAWQQRRNEEIEARNTARYEASRMLWWQNLPPAVEAKIEAARAAAGREHVTEDRVVFSSDDASDGAAASAQAADEAADFERRLRERERSRGSDAPRKGL